MTQTDEKATADAIAAVLTTALESGEIEPLLGRLAPGAKVWHNHDHDARDAVESFRAAAMLHELASDIRIDTVRLEPLPNGFVWQAVIRGTVKSHGGPLEMHNCLVVTTDGGMVTRVDEYVDPNAATQFAPPPA